MLIKKSFFHAIVAALITLSFPSLGQQKISLTQEQTLPIEISADTLEVEQEKKLATFSGNVMVKQGNIRLRAETIQVRYRPKGGEAAIQRGISHIDATGKVFFSSPGQTAQGDSGVYEVDKSLIIIRGNVVLTREKNVIRGDRLELNLVTGKSKVGSSSGENGGRVRGVFMPNEKAKR